AADYGLRDVRRVFERVAVIENQVGRLAWLQAAELVINSQNTGGVQGNSAQGAIVTQSVYHRHRRLEAQHTRLGDITLERSPDYYGNLLLRQSRGIARVRVIRLQGRADALHGRMNYDRHLGLRDCVRDQVAFRRQIEDRPQVELFRQAQCRAQIVR